MAETEIELTVKWENGAAFEVTAKEDAGPTVTIVKAEENGDMAALWSAITDVMERYIKTLMARIGKDMAKEE